MDLDVGPTALGGRFTTVEGVITAMKEQLGDNGFILHDSQEAEESVRLKKYVFENLRFNFKGIG